jgi:hypothetical protein
MNFKRHVEYAIYHLNTIRPDNNTCYLPGCGIEIPEEFLDETGNVIDEMSTAAVYNSMIMHSQWASWGLNTFEPTASLVAGLMITTPSSEPGLPHFPYPTFFIRIPPGFIPLFSDNNDANPEWADGLLVSRLRMPDIEPPAFCIFILVLGNGDGLPDNPELSSTIMTPEKQISSAADYVKVDDEVWNNKYKLWNEKFEATHNIKIVNLEDQSVPETIVNVDNFHSSITLRKANRSNRSHATNRLAIRLIANLCTWLESKGGLSGQSPSNAHHGKTRNNPGWESIHEKTRISQWILGQEVKLSPELIASAKEHVLALATGEKRKGWHLQTLQTVCGHFTNQPYGPKSSERKRIWIQPYPRGLKGGDVTAHVYKVKEGKHYESKET